MMIDEPWSVVYTRRDTRGCARGRGASPSARCARVPCRQWARGEPAGWAGCARVTACRVCVAICDSACAVIFKRSAYGERARACGRARVRIYHLRCAMGRRIPDVVEN